MEMNVVVFLFFVFGKKSSVFLDVVRGDLMRWSFKWNGGPRLESEISLFKCKRHRAKTEMFSPLPTNGDGLIWAKDTWFVYQQSINLLF